MVSKHAGAVHCGHPHRHEEAGEVARAADYVGTMTRLLTIAQGSRCARNLPAAEKLSTLL